MNANNTQTNTRYDASKWYKTVSVIIPIWSNTNPVLFEKSLKSLCDEAELILETIVIVDDQLGSKVEEILEADFSKINLVIIKNYKTKGVSGSRNVGINYASGDYIAFLDDDDRNINQRIQKEIEILSTRDIDIVGSSIQFYDDQGIYEKYRRVTLDHDKIIKRTAHRSPFNLSTVMVKSSLIKQHQFNETLEKGEDYELWCRLLNNGAKSTNLNEVLVLYYHQRNNSHKRIGLNYFISDVKIKVEYIKNNTNTKIPFAIIFACLTSIHRLLPNHLFNLFYGSKK